MKQEDHKIIAVESTSFFVDDMRIDKIDKFRIDRYGLFPQDLEHSEDTRIARHA